MGSRVSVLFAGPSVLGRRARARARVVCARVVCVRLRMPRSISLPLLSDPFQHGFPLVEITPHEHGRGCAREYSRAQRQQAAFSPLVSLSTHTGVLGALTRSTHTGVLGALTWSTRNTHTGHLHRYYEAARELSPPMPLGSASHPDGMWGRQRWRRGAAAAALSLRGLPLRLLLLRRTTPCMLQSLRRRGGRRAGGAVSIEPRRCRRQSTPKVPLEYPRVPPRRRRNRAFLFSPAARAVAAPRRAARVCVVLRLARRNACRAWYGWRRLWLRARLLRSPRLRVSLPSQCNRRARLEARVGLLTLQRKCRTNRRQTGVPKIRHAKLE